MLKIILKSGAKLRVGHEFWATNDMPNVIFDLESSEPSTFITLKLTPTETIRLCDALSELVNVIGETCSTGANPINDGVYTSLLDLHPRAERLLKDAGVTVTGAVNEIQVAPICNTETLPEPPAVILVSAVFDAANRPEAVAAYEQSLADAEQEPLNEAEFEAFRSTAKRPIAQALIDMLSIADSDEEAKSFAEQWLSALADGATAERLPNGDVEFGYAHAFDDDVPSMDKWLIENFSHPALFWCETTQAWAAFTDATIYVGEQREITRMPPDGGWLRATHIEEELNDEQSIEHFNRYITGDR